MKIDKNSLTERTFSFAVNILKFLKTMKYSKENDVVRYQLAKAASSIGANYEEAQGAFSKEDFNYKIGICLKETKESNYWLRIIKSAELSNSTVLDDMIKESFELKCIFASIMKKVHFRHDV